MCVCVSDLAASWVINPGSMPGSADRAVVVEWSAVEAAVQCKGRCDPCGDMQASDRLWDDPGHVTGCHWDSRRDRGSSVG